MASSSSVQFKRFLFNQVDDIAGNEVSPTKQARAVTLTMNTYTTEQLYTTFTILYRASLHNSLQNRDLQTPLHTITTLHHLYVKE